jgi:hypothetical protein
LRQALEAGLLDEIGVELVPFLLGAGTPLFADYRSAPVEFEGPLAGGVLPMSCRRGDRPIFRKWCKE